MFRKIVSDNALIFITGTAIIAVTLIGLLFAGKKSEPVYLSKIDKLMFDKDNKSPKFVLSLPSWDKVLASAKENKSFEINDDILKVEDTLLTNNLKEDINKVVETKDEETQNKKALSFIIVLFVLLGLTILLLPFLSNIFLT